MWISQLKQMGFCGECNKWFELEGAHLRSLSKHAKQDGVECSGSGYSPKTHKYVVETLAEAQLLADFILKDEGRCLLTPYHSGACGDGDGCDITKRKLARALAEYSLANPYNTISKRTYALEHNPNYSSVFLVRLPGKSGVINLKPINSTDDFFGHGNTIQEAFEEAIQKELDAKR